MTGASARASAPWLALREPADAAARACELVDAVRPLLPTSGGLTVHDLGCGTGSMMRWLGPQLSGPQHWLLHDRDAELLTVARGSRAVRALDGAEITSETRLGDVTRLTREAFTGADLVTGSALLDVMSTDELDRILDSCAAGDCPVYLTLTVTGEVELVPADPFDDVVRTAFNAHQRRTVGRHRLLGPDAADAAADRLRRLGLEVLLRPSPWRLGPDRTALVSEWFTGWLSAACEQRPELASAAERYRERRLTEAASGTLTVTVHHVDLLASPRADMGEQVNHLAV